MIRRWPIRAQLLALVLAVALPAAGLVGYLIYDTEREAIAQAEARVHDIAGRIAQNLALFLRDQEALLARIAERPLVQALNPESCDPVIHEYVGLHPEFTTLALRDLNGAAICSHFPLPLAAGRVAAFPWFQEGVTSPGFRASDAFLGQQTGRWVSVLTQPVRDAAGSVRGLLVLPVDLARLQARIVGTPTEGVIAGVLDREGLFLMRTMEPDEWIGRPGRLPGLPEAFWREREGFVTVRGVDGVARLYAFTTLADAGWRGFAGLPVDTVFAADRRRFAISALIGLAALLAAGGAA